jgi:tetratricopeptide (TPR) repeat protein
MEVLDTKIQNEIDEKRFEANEFYLSDKEKYFKLKNEAWELYPEPKENWAEAYSLAKDFFETYLEESDFENAKKWLNIMIAHNNNLHLMDDNLWFNVGKYYFETKEYNEALNHFKEVVKEAGMRYFENEDPKYLNFYKNPQKYLKQ